MAQFLRSTKAARNRIVVYMNCLTMRPSATPETRREHKALFQSSGKQETHCRMPEARAPCRLVGMS